MSAEVDFDAFCLCSMLDMHTNTYGFKYASVRHIIQKCTGIYAGKHPYVCIL